MILFSTKSKKKKESQKFSNKFPLYQIPQTKLFIKSVLNPYPTDQFVNKIMKGNVLNGKG